MCIAFEPGMEWVQFDDLRTPTHLIPVPESDRVAAPRWRGAAGGVRNYHFYTAAKLFPEFPLFSRLRNRFTCSKFLKIFKELFSKSSLNGV